MQILVDGHPVDIRLWDDPQKAEIWKPWAINQYRKLSSCYTVDFKKTYQLPNARVEILRESRYGYIDIWGEGGGLIVAPHFLWRGTQISPDSLVGLGLDGENPNNLYDEMFGDTLKPTAYFRDGVTEYYASTVSPPSYLQGKYEYRLTDAALPKLIYHLRSPCRYTGEMRWLMQEMWAANILFNNNTSDRPVLPFSYTVQLTHGLASYPSSDEIGYWLVEVGTQGVYALNLGVLPKNNLLDLQTKIQDVCKIHWAELDADISWASESVLGGVVRLWGSYKALPKEHPERPLQLLTAEDMVRPWDKGPPWSPYYGWAFSESGHECQNVFGSKGISNLDANAKYGSNVAPLGAYPSKFFAYEMERWKITFEVTSESISANLTSEEIDSPTLLFPGGRRGGSQYFVPVPLTGGMLKQQTAGKFSMYRQATNAVSAETCHQTDAPIFVFYDGDKEQVVRWKQNFIAYNPKDTYETNAPLSPSEITFGWTDGLGCHGADTWIYTGDTRRYEQGFFGIPGKSVSISWEGSAEHRIAVAYSIGQIFSGQSSGFNETYGRFITEKIYPTYYGANATQILYRGYSEQYIDALVLPIYDRESVYFVDVIKRTGHLTRNEYKGWGYLNAPPVRSDYYEYVDGNNVGDFIRSYTPSSSSPPSSQFPSSNPDSTTTSTDDPNESRQYSGLLYAGRVAHPLTISTDAIPPEWSWDGVGGDDYETALWTSNQFAKAVVFQDDSIIDPFISEPFWAMASWHNGQEAQLSYILGKPNNIPEIVNSKDFAMTANTFPTAVVRDVNLPVSELDNP
jgi:hypothetical protein